MGDLSLDELSSLLKADLQEVEKADSKSRLPAIEALRVKYLGKSGVISEQMKLLGKIEPEKRKEAGARINAIKAMAEKSITEHLEKIQNAELDAQIQRERIDVTLPGVQLQRGYEHPVWKVQTELVEIFHKCGFVVELGPEVEHEFFNFDALNMPKNHPARAMQDTFYIAGSSDLVLRTHTSPVQIRTMLMQKPPIRMICPGRVYRSDYDPTHSPMFHQIEGLLIDKNVVMGDLKGLLDHMVKEFFGESLGVRLRPSFFPFTEPSAEVDMACVFCNQKGCKTCKQTGWIEIGGCGMVDPEVFKAVDLNPEEWAGFAFGMGLERMTMLKYGVNDLRAFYESDQRFLKEFG
jgi:phenylalanyl-tRNA synthetase alpha chain